MERLELPPNWSYRPGTPRWTKPYGYCFRSLKLIETYPPKWIPFFMRTPFVDMTYNHEVLHAWGNPGCGNKYCLGYEGEKWDEYKAFIKQALGGFRFCHYCMGYYGNH